MIGRRRRSFPAAACLVIACLLALPSLGVPAAGGTIREERKLQIDGEAETWRLVWRTPPLPACDPEGLEWFTCPCGGFAYGERGDLDLIRVRAGAPEERLSLGPYFEDSMSASGSTAVVARWPVSDEDMDLQEKDQNAFSKRVRRRAAVRIMEFRDYDHDGRASEFLLQVDSLPCKKRIGVVLGVSRDHPGLHAFGTALHPDVPLALRIDHWEALERAEGHMVRVDWACGDHGSDTQDELELWADAKGIHAVRRTYACDDDLARGALVETVEE